MAFGTGSDLIQRFDVRLIGDLVTDAGETLPADQVASHPNVAAALGDASGEMVVALLTGGRYTEAQLTALTGYSAAHRTRVCCDIAMANLIKRRPMTMPDRSEEYAKQAREHLKALAAGQNLFGIQEVIESGIIELATPSTIQIENLNLLTERMGRYFPNTNQRMPRGQQ